MRRMHLVIKAGYDDAKDSANWSEIYKKSAHARLNVIKENWCARWHLQTMLVKI